jgi:hypothetical protein
MSSKEAREPRGLIYGGRRPEGYLLAHNHVRPRTTGQASGLYGFRRFWVPPEYIEEGKWVECDCGWRPYLGIHYRHTQIL